MVPVTVGVAVSSVVTLCFLAAVAFRRRRASLQTQRPGVQVQMQVASPVVVQATVVQDHPAGNTPLPVTASAQPVPAQWVRSAPADGDALRSLGELRDQGLLSQEEFDAKKAEILARL